MKNKMYPILELLALLPGEYADLATKRCKNRSEKACSIGDALYAMCAWAESPEGHSFWSQVRRWSVGIGELPPIPEQAPCLSGKEVSVTIDGQTYTAIIK